MGERREGREGRGERGEKVKTLCKDHECEKTHDNPVLGEFKVHRTFRIPVRCVVDGCPGNTIHQINTEECYNKQIAVDNE